MQWYAVLLLAGLGLAVSAIPISVKFLKADGTPAKEFNEGDTAICRCRAEFTDTPFSSAKFVWKPFGSTNRVTIAEGNQIVDPSGEQSRFSAASLIDIGDKTMDYRVTIDGLDRYDNGYILYCQFFNELIVPTGDGGVAAKLVVKWKLPSIQCSDIASNIKCGEDVSYSCSATDVDGKSNGTLSLWKNGDQQEGVAAATRTVTQYSISYTTKMTVDGAKDEYACRYRGIGGYEEYNTNCTFEGPDCVGDTPSPGDGSLSLHDHVPIMITIGLPILMMYLIA